MIISPIRFFELFSFPPLPVYRWTLEYKVLSICCEVYLSLLSSGSITNWEKFINKRKLITIFFLLVWSSHYYIYFFSANKETSNLREVDEVFNYADVFTIFLFLHEVIFWRAAVTFSLTKIMINYSILSIVRQHKNLSKSILFITTRYINVITLSPSSFGPK